MQTNYSTTYEITKNNMKPNQIKINPNKVVKSITERIENGEYKEFNATEERLQEIAKKLVGNENLSTNDLITLKLNGYLSNK